LALQHGFHNLAKARRLFNAQPAQALNLILSADIPSCEQIHHATALFFLGKLNAPGRICFQSRQLRRIGYWCLRTRL
ncbi:MAG: hypothetical protein H6Q37_1184, partial [Chloroflexi bacterium]|nr:hypothetical protein [Chloroflexota bacterium]